MPKNIVICSDGTGNSAVKDRGTNVFKLFEAVDLQTRPDDASFVPQIAYYDDGVGTERLKPLKAIGGAFGWGLSRNIRDLYRELARVYDPGDRIFVFGFSRGAYTVRSLVGMIAQVGIVDREKVRTDAQLKSLVKRAYREHRRCFRRIWSRHGALDTRSAEVFRKRHAVRHKSFDEETKPPIAFVGVWDTVDAVGFPIDEIAQFWDRVVYPYIFPDRDLSSVVERACHAIAIDDERHTFHPVMWNRERRIEQVWFAGAHSNVGGGYPKQGLSLVGLTWMMQRAEAAGLQFIAPVRDLFYSLQNVNDKLYNSRSGLASYYRYRPRDIAKICFSAREEIPRIHMSVIERIALGTDAYAPGNIPANLEVAATTPDMAPIAEALTTQIRQAAPSLLAKTKHWIALRQYANSAFVIASVLTLAILAGSLSGFDPTKLGRTDTGVEEVGKLWTAGSTLLSVSGWSAAFQVLAPKWWLWIPLLSAYLVSFFATRRMEQTYSEFWFALRPTLRKVLLGKAAAEPTEDAGRAVGAAAGAEGATPGRS
jgi:uncharacterized protein (DUF2235 family)